MSCRCDADLNRTIAWAEAGLGWLQPQLRQGSQKDEAAGGTLSPQVWSVALPPPESRLFGAHSQQTGITPGHPFCREKR